MRYEGNIYRPPSEANSYLLQVTVGCSHNKCTFCYMYKDKRFRIRKLDEIIDDIRAAGEYYGSGLKRVFLCDGDALILETGMLHEILRELNTVFPNLEHIATYAGPKSALLKRPEDLESLRRAGLDRMFLGVETGDDALLKKIQKGVNAKEMEKAGRRLVNAGFDVCCMVILGLCGKEGSKRHALASADIINRIAPKMLAALTLTPVRGTPLYDEMEDGEFSLPDSFETLQEMKWMLENLTADNMKFAADHASNYLPIKGTLQADKNALIGLIGETIQSNDRSRLKSEYLRGL